MANDNAALVVIDFQNAIFIDPPAYQVDEYLTRIAGLIAQARAAGMPVIFVQHDEAGCEWEAGTDTWQFPAQIAPQPGDFVNPKNNSSAFHHTGLQAHLEEQGIRKLFICGYATDFCIDSAVRHASSLDYDVVVISDAHTTSDKPHLAAPAIIEHHHYLWSRMGTIRLLPSSELDWR